MHTIYSRWNLSFTIKDLNCISLIYVYDLCDLSRCLLRRESHTDVIGFGTFRRVCRIESNDILWKWLISLPPSRYIITKIMTIFDIYASRKYRLPSTHGRFRAPTFGLASLTLFGNPLRECRSRFTVEVGL